MSVLSSRFAVTKVPCRGEALDSRKISGGELEPFATYDSVEGSGLGIDFFEDGIKSNSREDMIYGEHLEKKLSTE